MKLRNPVSFIGEAIDFIMVMLFGKKVNIQDDYILLEGYQGKILFIDDIRKIGTDTNP